MKKQLKNQLKKQLKNQLKKQLKKQLRKQVEEAVVEAVEEPVQETSVKHSGETVENNERVIYIDNDGDDSFTLAEVEYNKSQNLPYKIGFVASQEDAAILTEEGINCIKHARDIIESMIVRTTGYIREVDLKIRDYVRRSRYR